MLIIAEALYADGSRKTVEFDKPPNVLPVSDATLRAAMSFARKKHNKVVVQVRLLGRAFTPEDRGLKEK